MEGATKKRQFSSLSFNKKPHFGVRKLLFSSSGYGGGRLVDYFSQDCVHCQHLKPVSDLIDATGAVEKWWVKSVFLHLFVFHDVHAPAYTCRLFCGQLEFCLCVYVVYICM